MSRVMSAIKVHRAAPIACAVCCHDQIDNTSVTPKSSEINFRPVDMHQLRRAFPDRWGEFCRRHFQDAEHLATFMDVEPRTARYWWEGKHAPAAAFVLRAVTAFPDAASFLADGVC